MVARDPDLVLAEAAEEARRMVAADLIERIGIERVDVTEGNDRVAVAIVGLDRELDAPAVVAYGAVATRDGENDRPFTPAGLDVGEYGFGWTSRRDVCVEIE